MAKETDSINVDQLAQSIAKGITEAASQTGPIRQVPITRYRGRTVFNPTGAPPHKRPQFTRDYYQNGKQLEAHVQFDKDIVMLNQLKPGRYLDRKVEVIERYSENGEANQLEIRYPSATPDDRFAMTKYFRSFTELLERILAEQNAPPSARAS
jgi:hypothetical protein